MPSQSPQQRSLAAAIGAHHLHATHDSRKVTEAARAGFLGKFLAEVDAATPGLPDAERRRRAEHLMRAHMKRLALASSKARAQKRHHDAGAHRYRARPRRHAGPCLPPSRNVGLGTRDRWAVVPNDRTRRSDCAAPVSALRATSRGEHWERPWAFCACRHASGAAP